MGVRLEPLAGAFKPGDGGNNVLVPFTEGPRRTGDEELAVLGFVDEIGRDGLAIVTVGEADFLPRDDRLAQLFSSIVVHASRSGR